MNRRASLYLMLIAAAIFLAAVTFLVWMQGGVR
jgi:hypothetical protein